MAQSRAADRARGGRCRRWRRPCAAGTHWLTIIAVSAESATTASVVRLERQRLIDRRPVQPELLELLGAASNCSQKSKATCGAAARAGARGSASTKPSSVPAKSFARSRSTRRVLAVDDRVLRASAFETIASISAATCERILVVVQHAGAVHRRRAPPWPRRRGPAPACRTPRRAARRSLRARWRRGTDRRRRRTPTSSSSETWPTKCTCERAERARPAACSDAR